MCDFGKKFTSTSYEFLEEAVLLHFRQQPNYFIGHLKIISKHSGKDILKLKAYCATPGQS